MTLTGFIFPKSDAMGAGKLFRRDQGHRPTAGYLVLQILIWMAILFVAFGLKSKLYLITP